ncbi:DNA-directed RNA polymerase III subunit RPC4 [Linum perenne]
MDHGDPPPTRRKPLKFAPKSASQRKPKLATPKAEEVSDGSKEEEAEKAQQIMNRFNENLKRQVTRAEKKSAQAQVVFGAPASSPSIRKFGVPKSETSDHHGNKSSSSSRKKKSYVIASDDDDDEPGDAMQIDGSSRGGIDGSRQRIAKQYKEPFDYESSYYPTTLPLRKPYSGDPDVLDEEEFGKAAMDSEYDENSINPAAELGFSENSDDDPKMILFKFPPILPSMKPSSVAKGKGKAGGSKTESGLAQLPAGYMGKMVVYKSGAVKFKIGDVLYDVAQGLDCTFAQEVAAMNTATKECSSIGEIEKHAVVSVDVDSLVDSVINLD